MVEFRAQIEVPLQAPYLVAGENVFRRGRYYLARCIPLGRSRGKNNLRGIAQHLLWKDPDYWFGSCHMLRLAHAGLRLDDARW